MLKKQFAKLSICFIFASIQFFGFANSYRILGILPTTFKSHFIFGAALMKSLAEKGHQVYVISPFPQQQPVANYYDVPFKYDQGDIGDDVGNGPEIYAITINYQESHMAEAIFESDSVHQLLQSNLTFDAVICEVFYSEALFGFSEYFEAPLIGISSFNYATWNTQMIGSPTPTSYVPNLIMQLSDRMTFWGRLRNAYWVGWDILKIHFRSLRHQADYYNKYFPHLKRDMYTVRNNAVAVLINSHLTLTYPRPYVPNHVSVSGLHIKRHNSPLPTDLENFIRNAEYGVVYFSMGTNIGSKDFLFTINQAILNALNDLKQRVLWKLEDANLKGRYKNVLIRPWFPQQDVLAHENVKVFITQAGVLSVTEAIYYATPFIGIPVLADQFFNAHKAQIDGIGICLVKSPITAVDITNAVEEIINNKSYTARMQEMSARYRDQPMLPMDLAIYWVERSARQKGSKHLHCAGLDLNFFQYYSIDTILTLSVGIMLFMWFVFYTVKHFPKRWVVRKKTVTQDKKLIARRVLTKKKRR